MIHLKDFHIGDFHLRDLHLRDYALHTVVSLGVAVPLLFCAVTGFTSDSLLQDARQDAEYTAPYAGDHNGAIPLEASDGWQVRLRRL